MAWENQPVVVSSSVSKKVIPSICLGIPYKGKFSLNVFKSLYTVELPPINDMIFDGGSRPLDLSRNVIVTQALQNKFEYLCFYDSDIVLSEPQVINKLLLKRARIVSALYVSRANPEIVIGTGLNDRMITVNDEDVKAGKLLEVESVGMGCCLIHTEVFHQLGKDMAWRCLTNHKKDLGGVASFDYHEAVDNNFKCDICSELLVANFFNYTHGKTSEGIVASEDYYFCEMARKIGITPRLACDIPVWHESDGWMLGKDGVFTLQRGGGMA